MSPLKAPTNCATVTFGSRRISSRTRCAKRSGVYQWAGVGRPGVHFVDRGGRRRMTTRPCRAGAAGTGVTVEDGVLIDQRADLLGLVASQPAAGRERITSTRVPGCLRHRALDALDVDPPLEPVDPQRDRVLDAAAGDRGHRFVAAEPERQRHQDLQRVALGASIGRGVGLARAGALGADAQPLDQLGRHARAIVGDGQPVAVGLDRDLGLDARLLGGVERVVDQLLNRGAQPEVRDRSPCAWRARARSRIRGRG